MFQRFHNPVARSTAELIKSREEKGKGETSIAITPTFSPFLPLPSSLVEKEREREKKGTRSLVSRGTKYLGKFARKVSPRSEIPPGQLKSRNRTRSVMQARKGEREESNSAVGERYYLFDSRILRVADTRIYLDIPTVSICSSFDCHSRLFLASSFDPH